PPAVPLPPPPLTVPRTDTVGQLVEVTGPDPKSVLIVFCTSGRQAGRREPVGVAAALPPSPSARLGLFRSLDANNMPSLRAIRIRRDPQSGRWTAGDGRGPILTEIAPVLPAGAEISPIGAGA
ncbi:MAG: hypothetical protein ACRD5D_05475, partial [Candidatus Polarisedimenticolia bacterium]